MEIRSRAQTMSRRFALRPSHLLALTAAAAVVFCAPARADGDAAKGKSKSAMCEGCHGIPGYRTAFPEVYSVPKLGGQQSDYMIKALHDYKSGARSHPSMRGIAATLSDQDIADLAAYYADNRGK
jgi:cytochrome c553